MLWLQTRKTDANPDEHPKEFRVRNVYVDDLVTRSQALQQIHLGTVVIVVRTYQNWTLHEQFNSGGDHAFGFDDTYDDVECSWRALADS